MQNIGQNQAHYYYILGIKKLSRLQRKWVVHIRKVTNHGKDKQAEQRRGSVHEYIKMNTV